MAGVRDVTCLYGAATMPADLEALLGRFSVPEVVFCLDGDRAGQDATQRLSEQLSKRGIQCLSVVLPTGKDPNQLLQELGPEKARERFSRPVPVKVSVAEKSAPEAEESESTDQGFTLRQGDVSYRMTMIGPFVGRLRATMVATRGTQIYSEKLDLYSHRARALNATQLVRHLEVARVEAERHIGALLKAALDWVDGHKAAGEGKPITPKAPVLTEEEKAEALVLLRRPDLVDVILEDTQKLGFVGEEKSRLLGYLISLSRKLPRPLSGIVRSQSGAGKSTLTDMVEQMTPPEDVLFYSRLTPQVLYYMPHKLTGKMLILEERAGGEGADYPIRTLQSRSKLKLAVTIKNPVTGKMDACSYEVEGPVAFMETTTDAEINPENASRCFELYMDESEAQTERIQQRQRSNRLLVDYDIDLVTESIRKKHHNAQRCLQTLRVFIPYADQIKFPTRWLRTRRDNERFLCLIEAIAFLHQHQREQGQVEGKPYVLANLADYRLAYRLARQVLTTTFHELSRDALALWEALIPYVLARSPQTPKNFIFTLKDLRQVTAQNNHHLRTRMTELAEMEYVSQVANQNGKPLSWRVLSTEVKAEQSLPGLTTPDELERLVSGELSKLSRPSKRGPESSKP
jgi:DNA primase